MLKAIFCRLFEHRIDRNHVWYDHLDFRTNCRRCGQPLVRTIHGWRVFDPDRDEEQGRVGHPRERDHSNAPI